MTAPRKYDQEFREWAVRMYRERLEEPGESKAGARRHVGALLDLNPETLRNWADERLPSRWRASNPCRPTPRSLVRWQIRRRLRHEAAAPPTGLSCQNTFRQRRSSCSPGAE